MTSFNYCEIIGLYAVIVMIHLVEVIYPILAINDYQYTSTMKRMQNNEKPDTGWQMNDFNKRDICAVRYHNFK